jgi:predicted Zn-dependent peptidase
MIRAFAGLAATALVSAQGAPPQGTVTMKGRAPVSAEILRVKLPRPAEADLPNGIHLMLLEDHRVPLVTFQLQIPGAGGYFDPADQVGLAQTTAAMMREGTAKRTTLQISEMLETKASTLTVGAGLSSITSTVSGSSLTENFAQTFALAAEVLLQPSFPQEELDRYKTRTKTGLVQQRSQPVFLAGEQFSRLMYGSHPSGRTSLTPEGIDRVTRDALVGFHKTKYVPDHAVLAIAGDISMAEARKAIDAYLGGWAKAGVPAPQTADPPAPPPGQVHLVDRKDSVQTTIFVGSPAISRTSPDYDIVSVMNQVIGGGPTGRLFTKLREEKGYTYGAYSDVSAAQFRGHWLATMDVRSEVTADALRDLMIEITRMRDEPVPQKEFDDKRRGMIASFALTLESPQAVLGNHITRWIYKLPADYWDKFPDRVMAVTQAQVQEAAKKYLDPSKLQIVTVGEAAKIGDVVKKFGPVTTYDVTGKVVGK